MGTITFTTDKPACVLLREQFGYVRLFTTSSDGAAMALTCNLADMHEGARDSILGIYDLPMDAETVTMGVVIKGHGWNTTGLRSVEMKAMDETMGPYYTGGASHALVDALTPLRSELDGPLAYSEIRAWAKQWRANARSNAGPRRLAMAPIGTEYSGYGDNADAYGV